MLSASPDNVGMTGRILIIDDDPRLAELVSDYLGEAGFRASVSTTAGQGVERLKREAFDALVLDLMLPDADGLDVCRRIRQTSDVPILMLTARGDAMDRVVGLELGADDYLTKPFGLRELLARVRAVLRRREAGSVASRAPASGRYRFGGWLLDRRNRHLTDPEGAPVALTKGEYALLTAFLDAPQRPLSRERLLQATRVHEDVFDRSIDVQILRLRRKLEADVSAPRIIQTERGVGYVFALPVERV